MMSHDLPSYSAETLHAQQEKSKLHQILMGTKKLFGLSLSSKVDPLPLYLMEADNSPNPLTGRLAERRNAVSDLMVEHAATAQGL
jgi:hypothetical protein